jgi:hypothetical protein
MMRPQVGAANAGRAASRKARVPWRPYLEPLEARIPLAALPVAIDINGTPDQSDDLTLLDPGAFVQPIGAVVINDGTPRTIALEVSPPGAVALDRTSLELAAGASAAITITPVAVSQAANDVTIKATSGGVVVGSEDMTVVSVQLPQHIRRDDTPAGMPDRIPPRVPTTFGIQVTPDLTASGQAITLSIAGQDPDHGTATLDGMAETTLSASGTVAISGSTQTAATPGLGGGNAGNLHLVAQVRGAGTVQSDGFSIAAIPQNWSEVFGGPIRTRSYLGLFVIDSWQSDSGNPSDLSAVSLNEKVQGVVTGGLKISQLGVGTYFPAYPEPGMDRHALARSSVRSPGGRVLLSQTHVFHDQRTGALDIPVTNSGYLIEQIVSRGRGGSWVLTTIKEGSPATALGFPSGAGAGGPFVTSLKGRA